MPKYLLLNNPEVGTCDNYDFFEADNIEKARDIASGYCLVTKIEPIVAFEDYTGHDWEPNRTYLCVITDRWPSDEVIEDFKKQSSAEEKAITREKELAHLAELRAKYEGLEE